MTELTHTNDRVKGLYNRTSKNITYNQKGRESQVMTVPYAQPLQKYWYSFEGF